MTKELVRYHKESVLMINDYIDIDFFWFDITLKGSITETETLRLNTILLFGNRTT